jgi:ferritin-like protein
MMDLVVRVVLELELPQVGIQVELVDVSHGYDHDTDEIAAVVIAERLEKVRIGRVFEQKLQVAVG